MEPQQNTGSSIAFISKYLIPAAAKETFLERQQSATAYIHTLSGFIQGQAYERMTENGDTEYITIATWTNEDALNAAREMVQAENLKNGFNRAELLERLGIKMEPGVFNRA